MSFEVCMCGYNAQMVFKSSLCVGNRCGITKLQFLLHLCSLPATLYSSHVLLSETGSRSCTAAKTVEEKEETQAFITVLHTLVPDAHDVLIPIFLTNEKHRFNPECLVLMRKIISLYLCTRTKSQCTTSVWGKTVQSTMEEIHTNFFVFDAGHSVKGQDNEEKQTFGLLTYMAKEEERQQKSETSPHPGLKSLWGDTEEELGIKSRRITHGTLCRSAVFRKRVSFWGDTKSTQMTLTAISPLAHFLDVQSQMAREVVTDWNEMQPKIEHN